MKNIRDFLSENFHFLVAKCSVYLNRYVFVMSPRVLKVNLLIFRYKSLRSAPNIFVVNLSAADLGVTILSTPVLVYNCFTGNHMGKFGKNIIE